MTTIPLWAGVAMALGGVLLGAVIMALCVVLCRREAKSQKGELVEEQQWADGTDVSTEDVSRAVMGGVMAITDVLGEHRETIEGARDWQGCDYKRCIRDLAEEVMRLRTRVTERDADAYLGRLVRRMTEGYSLICGAYAWHVCWGTTLIPVRDGDRPEAALRAVFAPPLEPRPALGDEPTGGEPEG